MKTIFAKAFISFSFLSLMLAGFMSYQIHLNEANFSLQIPQLSVAFAEDEQVALSPEFSGKLEEKFAQRKVVVKQIKKKIKRNIAFVRVLKPAKIKEELVKPAKITTYKVRELHKNIDLPQIVQFKAKRITLEEEQASAMRFAQLFNKVKIKEIKRIAKASGKRVKPVSRRQIASQKKSAGKKKDIKKVDEVKIAQAAAVKEKTVEPVFFTYKKKSDKEDLKTTEKLPPSSSEIKSNVEEQLLAENEVSEELGIQEEFFDLAKLKKDVEQNKVKKVVSNQVVTTTNVVSTQKSVMDTHKENPAQKMTTQDRATVTTQKPFSSKVQEKQEDKKDLNVTQKSVASENKITSEIFYSETELAVNYFSTKGAAKLNGYSVISQDYSNENWKSSDNGKVVIKTISNGPQGVRSLLIDSDYIVPTHFKISTAQGLSKVIVPVLDRDKLEVIGARESSDVPSGHLIVELDDGSDRVEVDGSYVKKIYLNHEMRVTDQEDYRYVLFSGLEVGNRTITTFRGYRKSINIVHIHDRELTFDFNVFRRIKKLETILLEEDILSKDNLTLEIPRNQIVTFNQEKASQKKGINHYYWNNIETHMMSRNLLQLSHQSLNLFVGVGRNKQEVIVPSEDYIVEMRDIKLGLAGNDRACVVQVNLSQKAQNYSLAIESFNQSIITYSKVLDSDGKLYDSFGGNSEKIFIVGENQSGSPLGDNGIINVKIDYKNGSSDYFSTYCSKNSYIVEQL